MMPFLKQGDSVLAIRFWPSKWLRRGQIVIVTSRGLPTNEAEKGPNTAYIKRIVGLPGDELRKQDFELEFQTDQVNTKEKSRLFWHVPPGHVFVCGDNLTVSIDSRTWGPIPWRNVSGIVVKRLKSNSETVLHRAGTLSSDDPA